MLKHGYKLFILCAFLVVGPSLVLAEEKVESLAVGVVDIQAVLQKSVAGKNIQTQLDKKRKEYQKQISAKEDSLRTAEKKILDQRDKLSEAEFNTKRESFEKDVIAAQKLVQKNKRSLDTGFSRALSKLRDDIRITIADVAKGKRYAMVVSRDAVIIAAKDMDITKEVITALDKRVKKVPIDWSVKN